MLSGQRKQAYVYFHNKSWMNGRTEQQRRERRNKSPTLLFLAAGGSDHRKLSMTLLREALGGAFTDRRFQRQG